jgi:hypothetical protein
MQPLAEPSAVALSTADGQIKAEMDIAQKAYSTQ